MSIADIIILIGVFVFIGLIIFFNIKANKRGNKCCNCPYSKQCSINKTSKNEKDCLKK